MALYNHDNVVRRRGRARLSGKSRVIEGYLAYLTEVQKKAAGTIRDIRCTLNRLSQVIAESHPGQSLWQLSLTDYLNWMEQERRTGRTANGLAKNLSHIHGFLNYAWRSGRCERNVLDGFYLQDDAQRQPPQVLSLTEARALVEACPRTTARQRRDRMIILIFYGCGLRTSELCALRMQDVDREQHELMVQGKGERQRNVPIPVRRRLTGKDEKKGEFLSKGDAGQVAAASTNCGTGWITCPRSSGQLSARLA